MPPRKYWRIGYRNDRGRRAIDDWYEGFRHGASVAQEGGYRDQAVIPSSLWTQPMEGHDEYFPLDEMEAEPPIEIEDTEPTPAEALPTPAEPMPSAIDLDLAPPPPMPPQELSQDPLEDLPAPSGRELEARLLEVEATHFEQPLQPSREEATAEGTSNDPQMVEQAPEEVLVEVDPDGPPAPPWRRTVASRMSPTKDTPAPKAGKASFDPFAGTPFRETLGLTSPRSPQPSAREGRAERPLASAADTDLAEEEPQDGTESAVADDADPADEGWQAPVVPPSSWKSRN